MPGEIHAAFFEADGAPELFLRDFVREAGDDGRLQRARVVIRRFEER